ncbi:hypothetical protein LZ31DRAFT_143769 [Colletotrichum somersetense]|nr:hypothetical protein LZ31DRAFT_143769 [Colletotrichum somersetense]
MKMDLSSSATEITMSQSHAAIVVHFNHKHDAAEWTDDICRPVKGQKYQVYTKENWSKVEFEGLKGKLGIKQEKKPKSTVKGRRTPEPKEAEGSHKQKQKEIAQGCQTRKGERYKRCAQFEHWTCFLMLSSAQGPAYANNSRCRHAFSAC